MPRDLHDPQYLRFITENMNKEQEKRLQWFTKNKERIIESAQFPEHYKDVRTADVAKANLNICLPALTKDHQNSMIHRRKKPIRDGQVHRLSTLSADKLKDLTSIPQPVMLPVDPRIKNLLKVRLPYGGRQQYLNVRSCMDPEEKYYNEEVSSYAYGWRLKESHVPQDGPKFGRYSTFMHSLYSRTGPQPDPCFYQQPPREPYSKCDAQPQNLC